MEVREDALTVTLTVSVPVNGMNVNDLEAACIEAARRAFVVTAQRMQESFAQREAARLERREWKSRYLTTRMGLVRLEMLKVRNRQTRQCHMLGNDLLELAPRQRMTRSVERMGVSLRVRGLSYRQSAESLKEIGIDISAMGLWRRVQARGKQRCRIEQHEQAEMFSKSLQSKTEPPRFLYLEADEIHIGAQRCNANSLRIKTGISYTARERVQGYSKARYRLADKRIYGGVENLEQFGKGWYALLERHHRISRASAVLYLTDGDVGLVGLRETHFPHAIHAHDRAHIFRDIGAAAPDEPTRKRWINKLCAGEWTQACKAMRQCLQRGSGDAFHIKKILRVKRKDFYGTRLFRLLHDPQKTQRHPYGTGGVEKNQEITIGRAMKKRGMAWTPRGAHHLSKLIFAFQHKDVWESIWMLPPP